VRIAGASVLILVLIVSGRMMNRGLCCCVISAGLEVANYGSGSL
jgi:hypothetical protein